MSGRTTSGLRAALVVAAASSAGAGLVHAAASGSHDGTGSLVLLFAACAAAQLGWAAAVVLIPTRSVLFLGVGINGAAVVAWFMSRTVGLPIVDAMAKAEPVGTQDLVAAALAGIAVGAALLVITQPISRRSMPNSWTAMIIVGTVALVVPVMGSGHTHGDHDHLSAAQVHAGGAEHEHDDGESGDDHSHSVALVAGAEHGHDDATSADADHGHASTGGTTSASHPHGTTVAGDSAAHSDDGHHGTQPTGPTDPHSHDPSSPGTSPDSPGSPPHEHPPTDPGGPAPPVHPPEDPHAHPPPEVPTGPIITLDDPRLTAAQRNAASNLLYTTIQAMAPFPTVAAVEAAGYQSIGDAGTGFEHFVNWTYFNDGIELDPQRIESIVIQVGPGGTKTVASAMYILNLGRSLANVPDIAGELTAWHEHRNLCWVTTPGGGQRLSGVTDANGQCRVGINVVTPPMMHVWLAPQPCGPFSGIEGLHGDACGHGH